MGLLDQTKDFFSALKRLAAHWPIILSLMAVGAFGALFVQKKFFPATEATAPAKPDARKTPEDKTASGEKADAAPEAGAESPADSVTSQQVDIAARPALLLKGQAKWDDANKVLVEANAKLVAAGTKAGVTANGRPLVVFTETDDNGFHYEAMLPIAKAPEGKSKLGDGVEVGATPAGKAMKFQHRGAYDEIDATYEAITAYLDEKGLDTKNVFVEEYLTDLKSGDDEKTEVDIYVFLK